MIMDRLYGGVCYAGIDTDPELKYPKVSELFVCEESIKSIQKISFRAPEESPSQTSRATSPPYLRALSNFSMARLTKELRWAG